MKNHFQAHPKTWLVTGAAGFIGSNLTEKLLMLDQKVVGMDNFSAGKPENLDLVRDAVGSAKWANFTFHEDDISDLMACQKVVAGVDYVLHQAALGSVPRSIDDPVTTNRSNIDGFLYMLMASRDAGVKRFVYAASSSTYGDDPGLPKVEDSIGRPLSPYAVTKYVNELYADVFARTYGIEAVGLRYFNVFGQRQDPEGAYAAVIPKWIGQLRNHETPTINGDGETSRDFCFIENVVQANLLAATTENPDAVNKVYNIAFGERTSLNDLFKMIRRELALHDPAVNAIEPHYGPERVGDVRHSLADISRARQLLGYDPAFSVQDGMKITVEWFRRKG